MPAFPCWVQVYPDATGKSSHFLLPGACFIAIMLRNENRSEIVTKPWLRSSYNIETRDCIIKTDDAFETLIRRYEQPICSYLLRLTGDSARAQDLAQETFLRAYQALCEGDRWENPRAWLYRVASRLATDDYRRRRLLRWLPLWNIDGEKHTDETIEDTMAEQMAVRATLAALAPKYRVPLVLYVCEGYSVAEVAEILGISVSAVKMRLSRARKKFRQFYQGEHG